MIISTPTQQLSFADQSRIFSDLRAAGGFLGFAPRMAADQPLRPHQIYIEGRLCELGVGPINSINKYSYMRFADNTPTSASPRELPVKQPAADDIANSTGNTSPFATILNRTCHSPVSTPEEAGTALLEINNILIANNFDQTECLQLARIITTLPVTPFSLLVLDSLLFEVDAECKREFYDFFIAHWNQDSSYDFLMQQIDYFNTEEIITLGNICLDAVAQLFKTQTSNDTTNMLLTKCRWLLERLFDAIKSPEQVESGEKESISEHRRVLASWHRRPMMKIKATAAATFSERDLSVFKNGGFLRII